MKSISDNLYKAGEKFFRFSHISSGVLAIVFLLSGTNVNAQDCTVFAGDDQDVCVNSTINLQGQTTGDLEGLGIITWTQIDGPAATIVNPNSLETEITGVTAGNIYIFGISTVCLDGTPVSDEVSITVNPITIADAGDDVTFCDGGGNLAANAPAVDETGLWSILGNSFGITISDPTSPTSAITLTSDDPGTAQLRWTITHINGCSSSDDVLVTNAELSDAVIVSAPDVCGQTTTTLVAEAPVSGTGQWTQESGPNTATIENDLSATTDVSDLIAGTYVFRWTVTGDPLCTPKSIPAEFNVFDNASAGADQVLCNVTSTTLNAGPATSGTGTWTVASKPSGAPDPTFDPGINAHDATLNGLQAGVYELTWKIESGTCETSDNMIITIRPPITVDEIPDATICAGGQQVLTAVASGGSGSFDYQWQYNNGVTWENVGTNNSSFTTPVLNAVGSYPARVIVTDQVAADNGGCQTTTPVTTITVVGDPSITVQPEALTTLCNGGNTTFTIVADENTGTPDLLYQWQVSTSDTPFDWLDVDGATSASYTTPDLTQTTWYSVVLDATGNGCAALRSAVAEVEINNVDAGSIGSDQTLCSETTPAAFTSVSDATGEGVISYQWQISTNGTDFTDIVGAELSTYAPGIVSDDTWYRRVATSTLNGVLCSAVSNVVKITVILSPVVDNPGDFLFCNEAATDPIIFSGTPDGVTFTWTNSNPDIGLAASGTGDIASFTATNSTLAPILATIEVTPVYTNGGIDCSGTPVSFTITVNPSGHVEDPGNVVVCNNNTVSPIIFETGNTGGTTTYAWTNNNTSIGLAASGTGDIGSFDAVNTGTEAIVATITVTPTFTSGSVSCEGVEEQFTITVNPTPAITSDDELTICDQTALNYNPTANIAGTTFSWTASVLSGSASGFSATGTGPITDVITNTQGGNAVSVVRYVITPQSPAGCSGPSINLDVSVAKCADLAITKTDDSAQFTPGTTVVYTVVVSNDGPSDAFGANITDNAPSGTSISSWLAEFTGGASGNANGAGNLNENIDIPHNATATYTISVNVPSTLTGDLVNTASISAPAGLVDNNLSNNSSSDTNTQNDQADLVIVKTRAPGIVLAGQNIVYTLTVNNPGPSNAYNVVITDILPDDLTFVNATPQTGTWLAPEWSISQIAAGASTTMQLTALVNPEVTDGTIIVNEASVLSNTSDPNPDNNSDELAVLVNSEANLSINKTVNNSNPNVGSTVVFTLRVSNQGPSNATGVEVREQLPDGYSYVSHSGGSYNPASDIWSIGNLATGNIVQLQITAVVKASGNYINTAAVSGNENDPDLINNEATATVSPVPFADLVISKTDGSTQYIPGTTVVYTVVVSNDGPSDAFGATVTDIAPTGTSISSWSAEFTGGASGNANGAGNLNENIDIPHNATATYTISVNVPSTLTGDLVNTASISPPAGLVDGNLSNNSSSDTNTQTNQADLRITKVGSPDPVVAGEIISYTITLTNDGPSLASTIEVEDILPASLTLVSATTSKGSWASPLWTIETMAVAETATLTIDATLNSNATSTVSNTASVSSSTIDPNVDNNIATEATSIDTSADLSIMKTASPEPAIAGELLTYTIVIENNGPSNATNVSVIDILPSELTFVSATSSTGSWSADTWSPGNLAAGNQATLTLVTRVRSNVTTDIENTATVSSDTPDPVPGNNSDVTTTSVSSRADLSITKVADNNPAIAGSPVIYTITVVNNGPSDAVNVRVQDVLPSQLQFVSAIPQFGVWSAPFWTIGALASGQGVTLTLIAEIDATASGIIFNTATVTSNTTDPVIANNTATNQLTVAASAVLSINKTAPVSIVAGSPITYTLVVFNQGPSNALNVLVSDDLPTGLSGAEYSIDGGNNWMAWTGTYTRTSLAAGSNFEVRLRANTSPGITGGQLITNIATASSPTATNDAQDTAVTTVRRSADLVIEKTRVPGIVLAGQNIVYTLTVNNLGPSNAQNVVVTDILPGDLTFVNAVPQSGSWDSPEWSIGQIAAGASTSMQLIAQVNPEVADGDIIVNEASVLSSTTDPDPDNNNDDLAVSVNSEANLSITKTVNNNTPNVGSTVVFTLRASNQGPSNATGVEVIEQLPDGYSYVLHSGGGYDAGSDIWTIGNLGNGSTVQLQITAIVNASGTYTNSATINGNENDPDLSDNVATVIVSPVPFADLEVNKTVNVPYQLVGQAVVFTVALTNKGPSPATSVQVLDNLPQGFTFQSASTSSGTYNNNTGIWSIGNLNAGSTVTLNLTALVKVNGPYVNSASASASENDPVAGNNSDNVGISVIHAVDDNFSANPINGYTGGTAGNVLVNDLLQGNPLDADDISISLLDNDGLTGLSISANGNVIIPASSKSGVYNATYRICEDAIPANCDIGVITIVVTSAPVVAVNDNFTASPVNGFAGGAAGNVLSNDLLNNAAVIAAEVNISISDNGGLTGVTINQAGLVTVPAGTPAGDYVITYQICEKLNPDNCDNATVTIRVAAANILAVDDDFTDNPVSGISGGIAGNVLSNDLLSGLAVNINNVAITLLNNGGLNNLTIDAQGRIVIPPGTTAGQYTFNYRICELLNPDNCDQAEVVVLVSAASIIAGNDSFGPVNGYTGMAQAGNILVNDLLNGVAVNINEINVSVVSIDDRLQLDVNTGVVGVLPSTPQGIYELEYRICEILNLENCDMAVASVTVAAAGINANNDSFGPVNGSVGGTDIGNILGNDMLNGAPVLIDEITLSVISADSPLTIDVETGTLGVLPGTASGNYSAEYQICEILNPENCHTAVVSVSVDAAQIIANSDDFGPFDGIPGLENAGNILANDLLNGEEVDAGDVVISIVSDNFHSGITLNAATGIVSVASLTPGGEYTMEYQICEILNPGNCDQAITTLTIDPFADLQIEKTVDNPTPGFDTEVTFTLTVTNNGPNPATGVVVVDELRSGFTYLSDNSEGAWDPDTGLWTIGDLASGTSVGIEIVVTINSEGDFINTANVSGDQSDPNMDNNTSVVNLDPDALADVSIEKTLNNLTVDVNDNVIFTLTAANNGPGNASNVIVTDLLPDGYAYVSHSGFGLYEPETGLWDIGTLSNGQSETLDITARVNATGNYTNVASIEANETDPDLINNSDEATVFPIPVADLAISKAVSQDFASAGTQVIFTLTVTNFGPSEATDVVAVDPLPDGFTYISVTGDGSYDPENGNWSIGMLENGATTSLQITALVNAEGNYINIASVSCATKDPDEENNSDSVTVNTAAEADLGIVKTSDKQRAHVGTEVVFTLRVTNNGPANATGVDVLDLLPDGFTYLDHSGHGSYNELTGEWVIGELANQLSVTLDITTRIRADGNTTNRAEISANEYDPITENNIASLTIAVDNELVFPEGFSPNDDGYNDRFVIYGLEQYPNNQLLIVNRWGNKVFEASPYSNDWDGNNIFGVTVGGRDLPEGTYFYILDPGEEGMEPIRGFIYLKR
jgi:uncharacterized repeat protein (TIGR01451 family)/gliding motility-associated-like protein